MARTSVYSKPMPNASLPRNSFSRGFITNLNWSAGMLLPVFCKEVPKGSHGRIDRSIFMRTAQLNTAAFPMLDNHIDFFKVPKRLLLTRYEEMLTNTQDANSTSIVDELGAFSLPTTAPYFQRKDAYSVINNSGAVDPLGMSYSNGALRLIDLLGYNPDNVNRPPAGGTPGANDPFECNLNAFRLLAYQKVYYDHFRNTAYESNDPFAYNADYAYQAGNSGNGMGNVKFSLLKLLTLRYVNLRKDYFTNLYPALNYSSSSPNGLNWVLPNSFFGFASGVSFTSAESIQSGASNGGLVFDQAARVVSGSNTYSYVSAQGIRAMFALDKLLRASAYAPKHVRDQIEARFGVKTKKSYGHESEYLGSFMNDIVIGEVTSTANTTGVSGDGLGAIGGKGVSGDRGGKVIEFDTNEDDCIILGVMYSLVRSVYDSNRIDRFNTKFTKEDYFQPEFMDLGLQPVYQYELDTIIGVNASTYNNEIRGYVPRYQEYKLSIDENHGLFNLYAQLDVFVPHFNKSLIQVGHGANGVTFAYFKMSPHHLDSIFTQSYDDNDPSTDQFFGEIQFKFDVRQNMSVHGQPRL